MKIHHCDENLSQWWKFTIARKIYHCYEINWLRWKYISGMKIPHWDEDLSPWIFIIMMKIYHCDDRMKLFGGTVPPPKKLFGGTVPPPKNLFGGTIPPNRNRRLWPHWQCRGGWSRIKWRVLFSIGTPGILNSTSK